MTVGEIKERVKGEEKDDEKEGRSCGGEMSEIVEK